LTSDKADQRHRNKPNRAPRSYGYGWVWDKACYNPVTGMTTGGGGGGYLRSGRKLKQSQPQTRAFRPATSWTTTAGGRDRSTVAALDGAAAPKSNQTADVGGAGGWRAALGLDRPPSISMSSSGSSGGSGSGGSGGFDVQASSSTSYSGSASRRREPNLVYTAAVGAVAHTVRTQAPPGSRVIVPPPGEVAAASVPSESLTSEQIAEASAAAKRLDEGGWQTQAAEVTASGKESGAWRDVYMSAAYYDPRQSNWGIEFRCRFRYQWNVRNKVTLLATVIKSGVITHGSASEQLQHPMGLAYPQVAVRGGTMLVTYTYSSYADIDPAIEGVEFTGVPAYAGACGLFL
jgi:hypothetical protein